MRPSNLTQQNPLDIISERTEEETLTKKSFMTEDSNLTRLSLSLQTRYEYIFEEDHSVKNLKAKQIFDRTFIEESAKFYVPEAQEINNYCMNILLSAKMEKEIAIICMIYLEKLMLKMGILITPYNWRRLTLTALILGSKIWDDESFENENFAKVFNLYSTEQINEMERMFIERIDYDLEIPTAEYTKYYFILRTFSRKDKRGATLRPLDVATVLRLQNGAKKAANDALEKYRLPPNKSFVNV